MKIYGNKPPTPNELGSVTVQKSSGVKNKVSSANVEETVAKDRVEISGKMKELMALINQIPDVRKEKLEEIKKSIESGNYRIDSSKIAEKILREI